MCVSCILAHDEPKKERVWKGPPMSGAGPCWIFFGRIGYSHTRGRWRWEVFNNRGVLDVFAGPFQVAVRYV
jgi:hypothetical protein